MLPFEPHTCVDATARAAQEAGFSQALERLLTGALRRKQAAEDLLTIADRVAAIFLANTVTASRHGELSKDPVYRDRTDDVVLAAALAAQIDLIASGDPDLLDLNEYQGIPIVTAAEALRHIGSQP